MKAIKEKALEKAFIRVMNRLIAEKESFLTRNIYMGPEVTEGDYMIGELQARIEDLQQKMMCLAKSGFDEQEYVTLAGEIDLLRERIQRIKGERTERVIREKQVQELRNYLIEQENEIVKFDEVLFRRLIEKIEVRSMVEVEFVLKVGMEMREVL